MQAKATLSSEEDGIRRQKSSLRMAFCRARIENATRTQRVLRFDLRQIDKQRMEFVGQRRQSTYVTGGPDLLHGKLPMERGEANGIT